MLAGIEGVEPTASRFVAECSVQLSYIPFWRKTKESNPLPFGSAGFQGQLPPT